MPEGKAFVYELSPLEAGIPMPDGTVENVYRLTIEGNKSVETDELVFYHAGIYKYKLMTSELSDTDGYECDEREYTVEVYVRNMEDGQLTAPEFIIRNQSGSKSEALVFSYELKDAEGEPSGPTEPPESTVPSTSETGDGGGTVITGQDIRRIFSVATVSVAAFFILLIAKRRKDDEEEIEASNISAN